MSEICHTPVALEFKEPLITSRGTVHMRRGFLLAIEHNGRKIVSESSLLPEFGTEHFEHAERILNGESLLVQTAPSAVFALDCLRYALEKKDDRDIRVPIAKLLPGGSNEDIIVAARHAALASYDTVKLKVAVKSLEDDINLVNTIALELPELMIRLDANLGWTSDDVRKFADALPREAVEWIEDPCSLSLREWTRLQSEVGVPFACDEAFSEEEILAFDGVPGFKTLVLKPARMGAIRERSALLKRMRDEEIPVVLSSMMDSSVGLAHLAHLASEWSSPEIAQGLGTLQFLKQDTLSHSLHIEAGHLVVPPLSELYDGLRPEYKSALLG